MSAVIEPKRTGHVATYKICPKRLKKRMEDAGQTFTSLTTKAAGSTNRKTSIDPKTLNKILIEGSLVTRKTLETLATLCNCETYQLTANDGTPESDLEFSVETARHLFSPDWIDGGASFYTSIGATFEIKDYDWRLHDIQTEQGKKLRVLRAGHNQGQGIASAKVTVSETATRLSSRGMNRSLLSDDHKHLPPVFDFSPLVQDQIDALKFEELMESLGPLQTHRKSSKINQAADNLEPHWEEPEAPACKAELTLARLNQVSNLQKLIKEFEESGVAVFYAPVKFHHVYDADGPDANIWRNVDSYQRFLVFLMPESSNRVSLKYETRIAVDPNFDIPKLDLKAAQESDWDIPF